MNKLQAPFPWFGGKSRVADLVWSRIGNVPNYVEPFFGSGAVMFGRPHAPGIETINDKDGMVANFWRAVALYPADVTKHADWPVCENDLHARHAWLVSIKDDFAGRLEGDPNFCDPHVAGWWVWGICAWTGGGWCSGRGPWSPVDGKLVKGAASPGIKRQRPALGNGGMGIHRKNVSVSDWIDALSKRMRRVRVCCGDWSRIMRPSVTFRHGLTGVLLDPPYGDVLRDKDIYACDDLAVSRDVNTWCADNGSNKNLRIALCGYAGEHDNLEEMGWDCIAWKASGGYGNQGGRVNVNASKERIWFSPSCADVS